MTDDVVTYDEVARWLRPEIRDTVEVVLGWNGHGTLAGYYHHRNGRTPPCEPCLEAAKQLPSSVQASIQRRHSMEQWAQDASVPVIHGQDESWQLTQYAQAQWGVDHIVEYR